MGFSHHPGPLPFVTVRDRKWANRLTVGELIEAHGEHGCDMPSIAARVVAVRNIEHSIARPLYPPGTPLCAVTLEAAPPGWRKVGHPVHGDWIFEQPEFKVRAWQYFCDKCGNKRAGLLDRPHGVGGYSWACPECGSHDIGSVKQ